MFLVATYCFIHWLLRLMNHTLYLNLEAVSHFSVLLIKQGHEQQCVKILPLNTQSKEAPPLSLCHAVLVISFLVHSLTTSSLDPLYAPLSKGSAGEQVPWTGPIGVSSASCLPCVGHQPGAWTLSPTAWAGAHLWACGSSAQFSVSLRLL